MYALAHDDTPTVSGRKKKLGAPRSFRNRNKDRIDNYIFVRPWKTEDREYFIIIRGVIGIVKSSVFH